MMRKRVFWGNSLEKFLIFWERENCSINFFNLVTSEFFGCSSKLWPSMAYGIKFWVLLWMSRH